MSEPFAFTAGGRRLRGVRIGTWTREESVLVVLHEGLGSIGQWKRLPDALAAATGLPALVYERYGYGGAEPPEGPRPPDFVEREAVDVLPEVLAACGIERPLLFGHSDGGTIALLFASEYPDRPVAVITEAAHVLLESETRKALRALRGRWNKDARLREGLGRYHADAEATFLTWADAWLSPENDGWNMIDRLPAITCPVLAIQGADDDHGTPAQLEAIAAGVSGPVKTVLIPACGHIAHRDQEAAVLARCTDFVAAVLAGTAAPAN